MKIKDCSSCICLHCGNNECMASMCEGAKVEPEFYEQAIESCHIEKCNKFILDYDEGDDEADL